MNELVGALFLLLLLGGIIWVGVSRATEDGFFTSICTLLVVFCAFQFAELEWKSLSGFLQTELGMVGRHSNSTAYWIAFLVIVAPGMLAAKMLATERVPFPYPFEQYATKGAGFLAGLFLFAAVVRSFFFFPFFQTTLAGSVKYLGMLFDLLRI